MGIEADIELKGQNKQRSNKGLGTKTDLKGFERLEEERADDTWSQEELFRGNGHVV
jgi:hypothetical protein